MTRVLTAIDPRGLTLSQWTDATTNVLYDLSPMPKLMHESDWKSWAVAALSVANANGIVVADPNEFPDWRAWAQRFNEVIDGKELT